MNLAARALIMQKILMAVLMTVMMMLMMMSTVRYMYGMILKYFLLSISGTLKKHYSTSVPVDCLIPKSFYALYLNRVIV